MRERRVGAWSSGWVAVLLLVTAGCGGSDSAEGASESRAGTVAASGPVQIDINAIFPAGPGRELLLNNCQNCHTWVPVVVLQMNEQEWNRWAVEHRGRVSGLTDDEFATLQTYLITNFNPSTPVPELPPALLESWTTY